jgi:hypothetical protein
MHSLDTLFHFLLSADMIVPGRQTIGIGREIGDVDKDDEGIASAKNAGRNMAWLLKAVSR